MINPTFRAKDILTRRDIIQKISKLQDLIGRKDKIYCILERLKVEEKFLIAEYRRGHPWMLEGMIVPLCSLNYACASVFDDKWWLVGSWAVCCAVYQDYQKMKWNKERRKLSMQSAPFQEIMKSM